MPNQLRPISLLALLLTLSALACSEPAGQTGGDLPDAGTPDADDPNNDPNNDDPDADAPNNDPNNDEPDAGPPPPFVVRPGVESVTALGVESGAAMTLLDADGAPLVTLLADDFGQAHFAYLPETYQTFDTRGGLELTISEGTTLKPGTYTLRNDSADPVEEIGPFEVLGVDDTPEVSLYARQSLQGVHYGLLGLGRGEEPLDGFNYIEMRDGVKLSAMVRFPDPALWGQGPWPTLVEYSGYSTSRPDNPEPGSRIATLLGFATVSVNMRGTGCSGGVFDVFNPAQHADGYDIVEVVARQPWVLHNHVGMIGLSYSGIAQLYVARTNPPGLAAITPQSVIGDSWRQVWPGGIYNDGFTRQWLENRDSQAQSGGQDWTLGVIDAGDATCAEHQTLRNQNILFEEFFRLLEFRPPDADDRSLPLLVSEIDVPVYLTGAFQDEQTGGQFGDMLDLFSNAPHRVFTIYNGRHPDGYSPLVLTRWLEFLHFYVARRVPRIPDAIRRLAGPELAREFGFDGLGFEDDRFTEFTDDQYEEALAAYKAQPEVRVLFESGAAEGLEGGAPQHRFEATWPSWPPPDASPWTLYMTPGGALGEVPPQEEGVESYLHDPEAASKTFIGPQGYRVTAPNWDLDWTPFPQGRALSYLTEPLAETTVVAGSGHAAIWITGEVEDVHVQVSVSEVQADGTEFLVQSGWLRAGHRAVSREDGARIFRDFRQEDFSPMPIGEPTELKIDIPSFAHAFRAGSRLLVTLSTPGRNHATWQFAPPDYGDQLPRHRLNMSPTTPSRLVLPVVEGVPVTGGDRPCPSLRGQPCRPWSPTPNDGPDGPVDP